MNITLDKIKKDYKKLMDIIGDITTINQLKNLDNKDIFGYIKVNGVSFYDKNAMKDINPTFIKTILYGQYGCLGAIFVYVGENGKIHDVCFDVWEDDEDFILAEQITIEDVTEFDFDCWMENLKDFLEYCAIDN